MTKRAAIFCMIVGACWILSRIEWEWTPRQPLLAEPAGSRSVTFLMGEDKEESTFFRKAELHFSLHPEERSDLVVRSMRSLEDVIRYLNDNGSASRPWGTINLVLHGNPNTGLRTRIADGGHIATPKRLVQAVLLDDLPRLRTEVVDDRTRLNVWACGIGKNPLIRIGLERLFRTERGSQIDVYCSPHFVVFEERAGSAVPERLKLSYWPYYFKRGYRPSEWEIRRSMRVQYPEVDTDWSVAQNTVPGEGRMIRHSYHIPASYTRIYASKDDRPELSTEEQKIRWVRTQPALMEQVEESGIPFDKFTWTVHKVIHTRENGERVPAVKAVGMSTVMCFLREEG